MTDGSAPARLAVEATGIERRYGHTQILRGIDLSLERGSSLALLGPNGAGKTTLLRILALVLRPTRGEVRIHGVDGRRQPAVAHSKLGFLAHELALYADLTPEENVHFAARLHGLDEARARSRAALEQVRLGGVHRPVRALSRGQQQRCALARALVHAPPLVLLDEPWTGLDPEAQRVLDDRLDAHRREGGSAVFTTHDVERGLERCDRVAVLREGRVVLEGRSEELTRRDIEAAWSRGAAA